MPPDRPLVFAHRGGAKLAPENTLPAFDRAVAEGTDGLELDVRMARDGVPVVIHDGTLDRTTNASGPVGTLTARELAVVDVGYRFTSDGAFPWRGRGVGVPTLGDVLTRYPRGPLIIELKENDRQLADRAIDEVRHAGAGPRVCFGSFHWDVLRYARRRAPDIATSASGAEIRIALSLARYRLAFLRPPFDALQVPETKLGLAVATRRFVEIARRADLPVQVWVVDTEADIRRLLDWGAEGIITDRPDVAVATVRAWSAGRRQGAAP